MNKLTLHAGRFGGADTYAAASRVANRAVNRAVCCVFSSLTLALACSLSGCEETSIDAKTQPMLHDALSDYVECLEAAARRVDDGRKSVMTAAHEIKEICAPKFVSSVIGQSAAQDAKTQRMSQERLQARELELSTMVILDERGQP